MAMVMLVPSSIILEWKAFIAQWEPFLAVAPLWQDELGFGQRPAVPER